MDRLSVLDHERFDVIMMIHFHLTDCSVQDHFNLPGKDICIWIYITAAYFEWGLSSAVQVMSFKQVVCILRLLFQ